MAYVHREDIRGPAADQLPQGVPLHGHEAHAGTDRDDIPPPKRPERPPTPMPPPPPPSPMAPEEPVQLLQLQAQGNQELTFWLMSPLVLMAACLLLAAPTAAAATLEVRPADRQLFFHPTGHVVPQAEMAGLTVTVKLPHQVEHLHQLQRSVPTAFQQLRQAIPDGFQRLAADTLRAIDQDEQAVMATLADQVMRLTQIWRLVVRPQASIQRRSPIMAALASTVRLASGVVHSLDYAKVQARLHDLETQSDLTANTTRDIEMQLGDLTNVTTMLLRRTELQHPRQASADFRHAIVSNSTQVTFSLIQGLTDLLHRRLAPSLVPLESVDQAFRELGRRVETAGYQRVWDSINTIYQEEIDFYVTVTEDGELELHVVIPVWIHPKGEVFRLYQLVDTPIEDQGKAYAISAPTTIIAVDEDLHTFIEDPLRVPCQRRGSTWLCPSSPPQSTDFRRSCLPSLLKGYPGTGCLTHHPLRSTTVQRMSARSFSAYLPQPRPITVSCPHQSPTTEVLGQGGHVLKVGEGCTASLDTWQFRGLHAVDPKEGLLEVPLHPNWKADGSRTSIPDGAIRVNRVGWLLALCGIMALASLLSLLAWRLRLRLRCLRQWVREQIQQGVEGIELPQIVIQEE